MLGSSLSLGLRRRTPPLFPAPAIPGLVLGLDAAQQSGSYLDPLAALTDISPTGATIAQSTANARPKLLPWNSAEGNYLHLPGVSGNYVSTTKYVPGAGVVMRIEAEFNPVDYTPSGNVNICGVWNATGDQRSWVFNLLTTGELRVGVSNAGASSLNADSSASVPNGKPWVAAEFDVGNNTVDFSVGDNGLDWTALGSQQVMTFDPFDASENLVIGAQDNGTANNFSGWIRKLRIYQDGTLVRSFDASRAHANSSTVSSTTGETWTINRSGSNPARIVSYPTLLFDTDDYLEVTGGLGILNNVPGCTVFALRSYASFSGNPFIFAAAGGLDVTRLGINVVSAGSLFQVGVRRLDSDSASSVTAPGALLNDAIIQVGRVSYSTADAANFVDGALVGTSGTVGTAGNTSATDSLRINIGALSSSPASQFFSGTLAALLVYNRALSTAERHLAERWLAARANVGGQFLNIAG